MSLLQAYPLAVHFGGGGGRLLLGSGLLHVCLIGTPSPSTRRLPFGSTATSQRQRHYLQQMQDCRTGSIIQECKEEGGGGKDLGKKVRWSARRKGGGTGVKR